MKKRLLFLMMLLPMLAVTTFTSCGDDDDDSNPLVGTWYVYDLGDDDYTELIFKSNMTCTWLNYESDRVTLKRSDYGRYQIDENVLTIWYDKQNGRPWTTTFTIKGKKMITTEGNGVTWTKK